MSNKAISGVLVAVLMATIVLGTWFISDPVLAVDYEEATKTANATINANVSCGFSADFADYVSFGAHDPGTDNVNETVDGFSATAGATNNVNITYWIMANGNLDKQGTTPYWLLANMTWDDNTAASYSVDTNTMTTGYIEFINVPTVGLEASDVHYFEIWLDYPNLEPGTYNNTIYVKCNESS